MSSTKNSEFRLRHRYNQGIPLTSRLDVGQIIRIYAKTTVFQRFVLLREKMECAIRHQKHGKNNFKS